MWYWTKVLFLVLVGAIVVWIAYEFFTFPAVSKLKNENPTTTSLIEHRIRSEKERPEKGHENK